MYQKFEIGKLKLRDEKTKREIKSRKP